MRLAKVVLGVLTIGVIGAAVVVGRATDPTGARAEPAKAAPPAGVEMVEAAQNLLAGLLTNYAPTPLLPSTTRPGWNGIITRRRRSRAKGPFSKR